MVTEDMQQTEKVGLKRKLTGPLLLGTTSTRSTGEHRPEDETGKVDEPALKPPTAAAEGEFTDLTEALSGGTVESCRGHREVRGEHDDITYRKGNRARWWRRFSSAVVCTRRQKKNVEESLEKKQNAGRNNQRIHEEKRRFNTMFRRVQTSSDVRTREHSRDDDKPSPNLQGKLRRFFTRAERSRRSTVPERSPEDRTMLHEAPNSFEAEPDEQTEPRSFPADQTEERVNVRNTETSLSSEAVTVMAEMSITSEDRDPAAAVRPGESPTEELGGNISNTEEHIVEPADGSGTTQTNMVTADSAPVGPPVETGSLEEDRGAQQLSTSPVSSELHNEQSLQPSTNTPSIRIELIPPDNAVLKDEEEDEEEGRSSENQNQHQLLLLLGFNHRELQLLQAARALVQAALHAAVVQLSREQQDGSECVHREPQGCRDHA